MKLVKMQVDELPKSSDLKMSGTPNQDLAYLDDQNKENFKQFLLNEEKFNVKSSYSENIYTTELDYHKISEDLIQRAQTLENVNSLIIEGNFI